MGLTLENARVGSRDMTQGGGQPGRWGGAHVTSQGGGDPRGWSRDMTKEQSRGMILLSALDPPIEHFDPPIHMILPFSCFPFSIGYDRVVRPYDRIGHTPRGTPWGYGE